MIAATGKYLKKIVEGTRRSVLSEKLNFKFDRIWIVFGFANVVLAFAATQRLLDRKLLVYWE